MIAKAAGFLAAVVTRGALALAAMILATNLMGPEDYGRIVFLMSLYAFLGTIFDGGMSLAAARMIAHADAERGRDIIGSYLLALAPAMAILVLVVIATAGEISRYFGVVSVEDIRWTILPGIGLGLVVVFRQLLVATGRSGLVTIREILPWAIFLAWLTYCWFTGFKPAYRSAALVLFWSFLLVELGTISLSLPALRDLRARLKELREQMWSYGLTAQFGRVIGMLAYQFDPAVLAYFTRDPAAVGLYGLAKSMAAPAALLASSVIMAMYRDFATMEEVPRKVWLTLSCVLAVIAVIGVGVAPFAMPILLPKADSSLVVIFSICLVATAIGAVTSVFSGFLEVKGHQVALLAIPVCFTLVSLAAQMMLSPTLSAKGAAIAMLLSYTASLVVAVVLYRRRIRDGEANA